MPDTMLEPQTIARAVACAAAEDPDLVGDFVDAIAMDDGVTDFRFASRQRGYEGWQWSVTLYHDEELDRWTVNESSLVPTDDSLLPPPWVPWKDRLEPTDLSVTDSIGTEDDDPRLEDGFRRTEPAGEDRTGISSSEDDDRTRPVHVRAVAARADALTDEHSSDGDSSDAPAAEGSADAGTGGSGTDAAQSDAARSDARQSGDSADATGDASGAVDTAGAPDAVAVASGPADGSAEAGAQAVADAEDAARNAADTDDTDRTEHAGASNDADARAAAASSREDIEDAVEEFDLSRRHVLSPLGRAQTAKRWYEGPRGPKSLSTKTAAGHACSTCGFFVPLKGELNLMFGVCANKWSPDDGRVVSLDHGCGEHSEIDPPEPTHLWVQSKPAFDDLHIDIIAHAPREERSEIELIERMRDRDEDEATDEDIDANVTAEDEEPENDPDTVEGPEIEETLSVGDESGTDGSDDGNAGETEDAVAGDDADAVDGDTAHDDGESGNVASEHGESDNVAPEHGESDPTVVADETGATDDGTNGDRSADMTGAAPEPADAASEPEAVSGPEPVDAASEQGTVAESEQVKGVVASEPADAASEPADAASEPETVSEPEVVSEPEPAKDSAGTEPIPDGLAADETPSAVDGPDDDESTDETAGNQPATDAESTEDEPAEERSAEH